MRVGIIGAGRIGGTIAEHLAKAEYSVVIANSRGPETLMDLPSGVSAGTVHDAAAADAVIISVPFGEIRSLRDVFAGVAAETPVIDTSNYFPFRDGSISGLSDGDIESEWVSKQLGHGITKAWNAILAGSFQTKARPRREPGRIALPVAGDDAHAKGLAMRLVDITGFDSFDAGSIADSWRQQPGSPAYCTELDVNELPIALAAADRSSLLPRREAMVARQFALPHSPSNSELLQITRETYLYGVELA